MKRDKKPSDKPRKSRAWRVGNFDGVHVAILAIGMALFSTFDDVLATAGIPPITLLLLVLGAFFYVNQQAEEKRRQAQLKEVDVRNEQLEDISKALEDLKSDVFRESSKNVNDPFRRNLIDRGMKRSAETIQGISGAQKLASPQECMEALTDAITSMDDGEPIYAVCNYNKDWGEYQSYFERQTQFKHSRIKRVFVEPETQNISQNFAAVLSQHLKYDHMELQIYPNGRRQELLENGFNDDTGMIIVGADLAIVHWNQSSTSDGCGYKFTSKASVRELRRIFEALSGRSLDSAHSLERAIEMIGHALPEEQQLTSLYTSEEAKAVAEFMVRSIAEQQQRYLLRDKFMLTDPELIIRMYQFILDRYTGKDLSAVAFATPGFYWGSKTYGAALEHSIRQAVTGGSNIQRLFIVPRAPRPDSKEYDILARQAELGVKVKYIVDSDMAICRPFMVATDESFAWTVEELSPDNGISKVQYSTVKAEIEGLKGQFDELWRQSKPFDSGRQTPTGRGPKGSGPKGNANTKSSPRPKRKRR